MILPNSESRSLVKESARVIAWGEIGLDYHYDNSPRDVQREVFRRQLQLAREVELAGHHSLARSRRRHDRDPARGVGLRRRARDPALFLAVRLQLAEATLELGFLISFAGILTFKKAEDLREVAAQLPLRSPAD